jgi:hypothetical protein
VQALQDLAIQAGEKFDELARFPARLRRDPMRVPAGTELNSREVVHSLGIAAIATAAFF